MYIRSREEALPKTVGGRMHRAVLDNTGESYLQNAFRRKMAFTGGLAIYITVLLLRAYNIPFFPFRLQRWGG